MVAEYAYSDPALRRIVDEHIDAVAELLSEHGLELPLERYELYGQKVLA